MNIFIRTIILLFILQLQIFCTYSRRIKSSCDEVDKELIAMGVITENLPKGLHINLYFLYGFYLSLCSVLLTALFLFKIMIFKIRIFALNHMEVMIAVPK